MQLFYYPILTNDQIVLPEEESKHIIRVLRKQKGDEVRLIDGKGKEAICLIEDDHLKKCTLLIKELKIHNKNQLNQ